MSARLESLRVLVVDDNRHMISIVKAILRGFGLRHVQEAASAEEGFAFLLSTPVDIIIVDLAMQPVDGVAFVKMVRTSLDNDNRLAPIIMLTAYSEKPMVEAARDAGVTEFCVKPVTPAEIYRKVAAVVNQPRSFIDAGVYSGPDRRRRRSETPASADRREHAEGPNAAD